MDSTQRTSRRPVAGDGERAGLGIAQQDFAAPSATHHQEYYAPQEPQKAHLQSSYQLHQPSTLRQVQDSIPAQQPPYLVAPPLPSISTSPQQPQQVHHNHDQPQEPQSPIPSTTSTQPPSSLHTPYDPPAPKTVLHDLNSTAFPVIFFLFLTAACTSVVIYAFVLERAPPKRWTAGAVITLVVILALWGVLRFVRYGVRRRRARMRVEDPEAGVAGRVSGGATIGSHPQPSALTRLTNLFSLNEFRAKRAHNRLLIPHPNHSFWRLQGGTSSKQIPLRVRVRHASSEFLRYSIYLLNPKFSPPSIRPLTAEEAQLGIAALGAGQYALAQARRMKEKRERREKQKRKLKMILEKVGGEQVGMIAARGRRNRERRVKRRILETIQERSEPPTPPTGVEVPQRRPVPLRAASLHPPTSFEAMGYPEMVESSGRRSQYEVRKPEAVDVGMAYAQIRDIERQVQAARQLQLNFPLDASGMVWDHYASEKEIVVPPGTEGSDSRWRVEPEVARSFEQAGVMGVPMRTPTYYRMMALVPVGTSSLGATNKLTSLKRKDAVRCLRESKPCGEKRGGIGCAVVEPSLPAQGKAYQPMEASISAAIVPQRRPVNPTRGPTAKTSHSRYSKPLPKLPIETPTDVPWISSGLPLCIKNPDLLTPAPSAETGTHSSFPCGPNNSTQFTQEPPARSPPSLPAPEFNSEIDKPRTSPWETDQRKQPTQPPPLPPISRPNLREELYEELADLVRARTNSMQSQSYAAYSKPSVMDEEEATKAIVPELKSSRLPPAAFKAAGEASKTMSIITVDEAQSLRMSIDAELKKMDELEFKRLEAGFGEEGDGVEGYYARLDLMD